MADIELVIKVDEKLYNYMQTEEYDKHLDKCFDYQIRFAVKDGVPLRKGHWNDCGEREIWYRCSECSERVWGSAYTFCPHCGAKMN